VHELAALSDLTGSAWGRTQTREGCDVFVTVGRFTYRPGDLFSAEVCPKLADLTRAWGGQSVKVA